MLNSLNRDKKKASSKNKKKMAASNFFLSKKKKKKKNYTDYKGILVGEMLLPLKNKYKNNYIQLTIYFIA